MSSKNLNNLEILKVRYSKLCQLLKGRKEAVESRLNFAKKLCEQLCPSFDRDLQNRAQKFKSVLKLDNCCQGVKVSKSAKLHHCPHPGSRLFHAVRGHKRKHDTAKPFKCRKCDYATRWRPALREHTARRHKSLKGALKCQFANCTFQTANKAHLSEHRNRIHLKLKSFKCDFLGCTYAAVIKKELLRHTAVHSESKQFKCNYKSCTFATKRKENLKQHSAKHSGNLAKFKCQQCNYVTNSKTYFNSHTKIHSSLKPFKCTFEGCSYASRQRFNLSLHQAVHTKIKPFRCDYRGCAREYAVKSYLNIHKAIHGDHVFECSHCLYETKIKAYFNKHLKKCSLSPQRNDNIDLKE